MKTDRNPGRRRRPVRAIVLTLGVLLFALMMAGFVLAIGALDNMPVHIVIDGQEVMHGSGLASLAPGHKLVIAFGLALALAMLVVMVTVPLVLLLASAILLAAMLTMVGIPTLVLLAMATVVLSPLILLGVLLWWALRRGDKPSATIET